MESADDHKRADLREPGDSFAPIQFTVTDEHNEAYLHAEEDLHPRYMDGEGGGTVHPALLINRSHHMGSPGFRLDPGMAAVLTHSEVSFRGAARVGRTFTITFDVTDTYERPRPTLPGRRVARGGRYGRGDSAPDRYLYAHGRALPRRQGRLTGPMVGAERLLEAAEVGCEAAGPVKIVTSLRTWLFSGGWPPGEQWPAKNIHTDLEFALECNLPGRNAAGAMMEGYVCELMVGMFGPAWLTSGSYSVKFIRTVDIGDRVTARARITARRPRAGRVEFEADLWCENQRGDRVMVGSGAGSIGL